MKNRLKSFCHGVLAVLIVLAAVTVPLIVSAGWPTPPSGGGSSGSGTGNATVTQTPTVGRFAIWRSATGIGNGTVAELQALVGVTASGNATQGIVELATGAEAVTGTDTTRAVTPSGLSLRMAAPGTIGGTTPAAGTFTTIEGGGGAFAVTSDGNTTMPKMTISKKTGVAGSVQLYSDNGTETYGYTFKGPHATAAMGKNIVEQQPTAIGSTGQAKRLASVSSDNGTMEWFTPLATPGGTKILKGNGAAIQNATIATDYCGPITEVDASANGTETAANLLCLGAQGSNYGQGAASVKRTLSAAAAKSSILYVMGTTQAANPWKVAADSGEPMYVQVQNGTIYTTGNGGGLYFNPAIGDFIGCTSFKVGGASTYRYLCKPSKAVTRF